MTNTWFVMIPPGYASKSDAEKELVDFRISVPGGLSGVEGRQRGPSDPGRGGQHRGPAGIRAAGQVEGAVRHRGARRQAAQNPQQQSVNPVNDAAQRGGQNSSGLSLPASIGNFFAALGEANTWIRVAKVIVGGVLLIVGLVHITGADNALASAAQKGSPAGMTDT